jgi:type II secretory pathway predicted ATPase ExeA
LLEHLCSTLDPQHYVIAKMLTTQTSADDTLRLVAAGFGISSDGVTKGELLQKFQAMLEANYSAGRRALLVVDEAQNLTVPAIEELRMLSNFTVNHEPPLQSFLIGQPQFRAIMALPELEQLRQRVLATFHLGPMGEDETRAYIEHRLGLVGWNDDPHFTDGAFRRIYKVTGGVPRRINALCSRLMLFGFLEETHVIDEAAVTQVAEELQTEIGAPSDSNPAAPAVTAVAPDAGALSQFDQRLARMEAQMEKNDKAIQRALAVIASRSKDDGS